MKLYKITAVVILMTGIAVMPSCSTENGNTFAPDNDLVVNNGVKSDAEPQEAQEEGKSEIGNDAIPLSTSNLEEGIAAAQNNFALHILSNAARDVNFAFSPLTVNNVFGMAATMAFDEEYAAKIANALGLDASKLTEMHNFNLRFAEYIETADPNASILSANSVISECGIPDIAALTYHYNPDVMTSVPNLQEALNAWISSKSGGLIKELNLGLEKSSLPRTALSGLIRFSGLWRGLIDKKATKPADFTNADGSISQVKMMNVKSECNVYDGGNYKVLRMPYGNKAFEMLVVLPDEGNTLDAVLSSLNNASLSKVISDANAFDMLNFSLVNIPRFEVETTTELTDIFNRAGLKDFPIRTILNGKETPTLLSKALNKTVFKVDEEGATGASVTTWLGLCGSFDGETASVRRNQFIANRPFAFFVREASTGSFLMAGAIRNMK